MFTTQIIKEPTERCWLNEDSPTHSREARMSRAPKATRSMFGADQGLIQILLAALLLERARVALVGGDAFGAPGYLRLSYATSIERIEEGLRRLDKFFSRAEAAA